MLHCCADNSSREDLERYARDASLGNDGGLNLAFNNVKVPVEERQKSGQSEGGGLLNKEVSLRASRVRKAVGVTQTNLV